eukprot:TRINITY_DN12750_c0_g1_i1.p1 TRINITY_DN12750_c0_g1~~TRINITY_DN12750_c0_g1_i1.p1  ORF type:complete len:317 (-),score=40.78 TRINITY_DN12750_c0_g1_i1:96-1046(-)
MNAAKLQLVSFGFECAANPLSKKSGGILSSPNRNLVWFDRKIEGLGVLNGVLKSKFLYPVMAIEESRTAYVNGKEEKFGVDPTALGLNSSDASKRGGDSSAASGTNGRVISTVGKSTNIVWQDCGVGNVERQKLLQQKGCVIWITGLSGSGKSTLACALSRALHCRGKLCYVLDGDNLRHGLNRDLSFKAEDRAENIRRVGEVGKLFADAGVICIASLISPYRRDRDACRSLLPDADFIEVYMNMPLALCESRDAKGLYKLARAGKIKGFTGVDDPYEPPLNCEIVIQQEGGICASPSEMAEQVLSYLEEKGFLEG